MMILKNKTMKFTYILFCISNNIYFGKTNFLGKTPTRQRPLDPDSGLVVTLYNRCHKSLALSLRFSHTHTHTKTGMNASNGCRVLCSLYVSQTTRQWHTRSVDRCRSNESQSPMHPFFCFGAPRGPTLVIDGLDGWFMVGLIYHMPTQPSLMHIFNSKRIFTFFTAPLFGAFMVIPCIFYKALQISCLYILQMLYFQVEC